MGDVRVVYGGEDPKKKTNAYVKITDVETGEPITGITKIRWTLEAGKLAGAVIELDHVPVMLQGRAKINKPDTIQANLFCHCNKRMEMEEVRTIKSRDDGVAIELIVWCPGCKERQTLALDVNNPDGEVT